MKTPKFSALSLEPVRREILTPAEFQKLLKDSPDLIARSRFVSPVIGKDDFGGFDVQYTMPRLKSHQSA
jgi:hypothetical protein